VVALLDNKTVKPIRTAAADAGACGAWQLIYDEIHAHAEHFQALAARFDELAAGIDVIPSYKRRFPAIAGGSPGSGVVHEAAV
jgi:hypothetical protein